MYRLGIDIGGTFTDFCLFNQKSGEILKFKTSSTPRDPSDAIEMGIREIIDKFNFKPESIEYLAHGTTVATNAVIEQSGAKAGLITTDGFKDLLEIARQKRPSLYDLSEDKPQPLIPRQRRLEVIERMNYQGRVVRALNEESVLEALKELKNQKVEAVAICFLNSYINAEHEDKVKQIVIERFPEAFVSVSSEVVPEFREYERLSTTCLNAYLGPVIRRYMANFLDKIKKIGISVKPFITQSNGGIMSVVTAQKYPVRTALSGPAAGVMGAIFTSHLAGFENIITFDMGGTSTDVCLIENGNPKLSTDRNVSGVPCKIPMVDVNAVGAGGGSIAWVDQGMMLKVGPKSAGAFPGPACYSLGGNEPTVTDANVILGRLNPEVLLEGRMKIERSLAEEAVHSRLCDLIDMDLHAAASGILKVVVSNMVRAVRVVSVERGYNPKDFVLVAYGGAGPLHAVAVARELEIRKVMIPTAPGILCAMGLLATDIKSDYVKTVMELGVPEAAPAIDREFKQIRKDAVKWLESEGITTGRQSINWFLDMRYARQNYELMIPIEDAVTTGITPELIQEAVNNFHKSHQLSYGYANQDEQVLIVNCRARSVGDVPKPALHKIDSGTKMVSTQEYREVFYQDQTPVKTPIMHRRDIGPGFACKGPLIVEQMDSTVVVPPGDGVVVDEYGNLIIHLKEV